MLSGAGILVVGRYVVAALAWVATLIVVRELSKGEFGRYQVIFSLLGIIGFIADLRLSRIVLRDLMAVDGEAAGDIVGSYLGMRLVIGVISYVIAMAWVLIGPYPHDVVIGTAVAGLNLVILSAAFAIILLFEARLWLRDVAISNVLGQIVQTGMTIGISIFGVASILWFSWSTVANAVALTLWLVLVMGRTVRVRIRVQWMQWWLWLKEAAPLALGAALDTVYFRIDIVMLSLLDTYRAVGIYSVGYKFSDLLGALPARRRDARAHHVGRGLAGAPRRVPAHVPARADHPDRRRGGDGGGLRHLRRPARHALLHRPLHGRDRAGQAARGRPGPALLHPAGVLDSRRGRSQPALPDRDARRGRAERRPQRHPDPASTRTWDRGGRRSSPKPSCSWSWRSASTASRPTCRSP